MEGSVARGQGVADEATGSFNIKQITLPPCFRKRNADAINTFRPYGFSEAQNTYVVRIEMPYKRLIRYACSRTCSFPV